MSKLSLKATKVNPTTTLYHDRESNDPVFIQHEEQNPMRKGQSTFRVEIHPDFKEMHGIKTPYTHLSSGRMHERPDREHLESVYNNVLRGDIHHSLSPKGVSLGNPVVHKQDYPAEYRGDRLMREPYSVHSHRIPVHDSEGDLMGHIHSRIDTEEYNKNNKIAHDSHTTAAIVDQKYMKKNKMSQHLIDTVRGGHNAETKGYDTVGNRADFFTKVAKYKGNIPSLVGGHKMGEHDVTSKTYNTALKPKDAVDRMIAHVSASLHGDEPTVVRHNPTSASIHVSGRYGPQYHHTINYIPPAHEGGMGRVVHHRAYLNDYDRNAHNEILESRTFSEFRKHLVEVASQTEIQKGDDVGKVMEHSRNLLATGRDTNGNEYRRFDIGPKVAGTHTLSFYAPKNKKDEYGMPNQQRYLVAHRNDDVHVAASMDASHPGVTSYMIGALAKKDDSTIKAHKVYSHFIHHGGNNVILSTSSQSPGGHEVWRSLAKANGINVHGYDPETDEVENTHPILSPDYDHETHGSTDDPTTMPGRENNKAFRLHLVAHKK